MATNNNRPIIRSLPLVVPLLLTARFAEAQPSPPDDSVPYATNFSPTIAILIIVIVSAFFFLGFFSVYIHRCSGDRSAVSPATAITGGGRSRRGVNRGLDPAVLETFPTLEYSAVRELKIGKETLECAVCLSEFEDDETLRMIPRCCHVFHPDCIDTWLATHVTCPVCRSNLAEPAAAADPEIPEEETTPPPAEAAEYVAIEIAVEGEVDGGDQGEDMGKIDLARIGSRKRPMRFLRSMSATGMESSAGALDRFTLRLPEHVRREIVAAGMLRRSASCAVFPAGGEGSSRRGYRGVGGEEGSSRGGRSNRLGRSERWGFLVRNFSARVISWRRGEGEATAAASEGSTKGGILNSVRAPFECLGGGSDGGGNEDSAGDDSGSSTAALARV